MAFGQQAGPPATARQVQDLLALLNEAGHADFRDARGPMGFTQRQAAGKFTRDEAGELIARLQQADLESSDPVKPAERLSSTDRSLRQVPTPALAAELQRRGWIVMEP